MTDLTQIAERLKAARLRKGLSQRALSEKVGVPQGHLSRIENGGVDLQASSLIEIARALDLELVLVPRQLVPAVKALSRENESQRLSSVHAAAPRGLHIVSHSSLHGLSDQRAAPVPAYRLDGEPDND